MKVSRIIPITPQHLTGFCYEFCIFFLVKPTQAVSGLPAQIFNLAGHFLHPAVESALQIGINSIRISYASNALSRF